MSTIERLRLIRSKDKQGNEYLDYPVTTIKAVKGLEKALADKAEKTDLDNVLVSGSQTTTSNADGGDNVYTFTDKSGKTSTLNVKNGNKGSTGNGISSIEISYAASSSNTTAPSTWYTAVQSAAAGAYLWTRVRLYYTNGTYSSPYYTVAKQGETGGKGDTGNGISSASITYQSGTSGTTAPTGTWQTSIPSVLAGNYLWTKIVLNYTSGSSSNPFYSVARQGSNGSDATVTVDSAMSDTSTNPVQNKTVKAAIDNKANIKTNPDSQTGDIIPYGGHLTIGTRQSNGYGGFNTFTIGENNYCGSNCSGVIAVGSLNKLYRVMQSAIFGSNNTIQADADTNHDSNLYSVLAMSSMSTIQGGNSMALGNSHTVKRYGVAIGRNHKSLANQMKVGHYSADGTAGDETGTTGDAFAIGNGTSSTKSNAFRVTYAGGVYGKAAYNSTGADYAEMFEWDDGNPDNEDRRGLFAYVVGDKIRLATVADTDRRRMGIISAYPAVVGDNFDEDWCGKYLTDIYGAPLTQTVHHDAVYEDIEVTDPETGEVTTERVCVMKECDAEEWIVNPDYNPDKEYIPRTKRKEYAYWSFIGKLVVRDDGTCVEGGYCYPGNDGIATACTDPDKGYYVMERLDDNHVRVLVR